MSEHSQCGVCLMMVFDREFYKHVCPGSPYDSGFNDAKKYMQHEIQKAIAKTWLEAAGLLPMQWSTEKDVPGSTDKIREFFEHKAREAREGKI